MHRLLVASVVSATAVLLAPPRADAGCICPELTTIRTGDLTVKNATIAAQTWTVGSYRVDLTLELTGVSATTTIDVLALGIPADEHQGFLTTARINHLPGEDPRATAKVGTKPLATTVSKAGSNVRAAWKLPSTATGTVTIQIGWDLPAAGEDGIAATKARVAEFCIDGSTKKALAKTDGFHRVDLALSKDMATNTTLRITRDTLPISLCAKGVKKLDKNTFEIAGRDKLADKAGLLPILFAAKI